MECKNCDPASCPGCNGPGRKKFNLVLMMVAAAIVVVVVVASLGGGSSAPSDGTSAGGGGLKLVERHTGPVTQIVIAARDAKEVAVPFSVVSGDKDPVAGAETASAVYVGPEKFNDTWREKVKNGDAAAAGLAKGHEEAEYPGFAKYDFTVDTAGGYRLWVRAFWVDKCGNSVAVSLDDQPPLAITDSNFGRWVWSPLSGMNAKPVVFHLDAGPHTLTLVNREDDCYIDQILLRDADANVPAPTGILPSRPADAGATKP